MSSARITLDNSAFSGRFRQFGRGSNIPFDSSNSQSKPKVIRDVYLRQPRVVANSRPARARTQRSKVLLRNITAAPIKKRRSSIGLAQKLKFAKVVIVFLVVLSVTGWGYIW